MDGVGRGSNGKRTKRTWSPGHGGVVEVIVEVDKVEKVERTRCGYIGTFRRRSVSCRMDLDPGRSTAIGLRTCSGGRDVDLMD